MNKLSYIVETNGENGVTIIYYNIEQAPGFIVWENGVNSFEQSQPLPDPELSTSPEYVRQESSEGYKYYRRTINLPSKSTMFLIGVLFDESETGAYYYESISSFLSITKQGTMLYCTSSTNLDRVNRESYIYINSNTCDETLIIPIVQDYVSIRLKLESYNSKGINGESSGIINSNVFEHTFHWLTSKNSISSELLSVNVYASGPRNGFIVYEVTKYVSEGYLTDEYGYSQETDGYYKTLQICGNGGLETVQQEVLYNEDTGYVYTKTKYNGDLKIVNDRSTIEITNYGRCFLDIDAYYVITLANVDNLNETCTITLRYENEET